MGKIKGMALQQGAGKVSRGCKLKCLQEKKIVCKVMLLNFSFQTSCGAAVGR